VSSTRPVFSNFSNPVIYQMRPSRLCRTHGQVTRRALT
jgi:hypothetical protein